MWDFYYFNHLESEVGNSKMEEWTEITRRDGGKNTRKNFDKSQMLGRRIGAAEDAATRKIRRQLLHITLGSTWN